MKKRNDVIQYLINKYEYTTYLEIGVGSGNNFRAIRCETKHSVDPNYASTYKMKSDAFFKMLDKHGDDRKYDIIFIDGDHSKRAVMRDVKNGLKHLNEHGIILIHDMNPFSERLARKRPKANRPIWYGDGYKVLMHLRSKNPYLFVRCIDTDCGIGIVCPVKEKQSLVKIPKLTYKEFEKDKQKSIGLISIEYFKDIF